ncbi:MAG: Gfo/Idh/MocA family oxidoreductase, partial [Phycisphaerales bacterium]
MGQNTAQFDRRRFLAYSAGAGVFTIVPRHVLGGAGHVAPSETIYVAGIGVGGVGSGQIQSIAKQRGTRVVALCDVDDVYADRTFKAFSEARRYRDFREMLEVEDDKIDAVYCGTPDHTHAVIVLPALKRGKHVCCVKPLTRTIHEER